MLVFNYNEESMIILEELIDFRDCRMIHLFQFSDLLFEKFPLVAPNLVFVNDIGCPHESCLFVNNFPELIELVLFQTWGKHLVLFFDTALNFFNEVDLFELDLILLVQNLDCTLIGLAYMGFISHLFFYYKLYVKYTDAI